MTTRMERMRGWTLALMLFIGIGLTTAKVYAVDCFSQCDTCTITYLHCGACGGDGCDAWGAGCDGYCYSCTGDGGGKGCVPI